LGGSGGIEAVATATIASDQIPPTINLENPDPECDLDYVPHSSRAQTIGTSNSFGFGGHNVTLALRYIWWLSDRVVLENRY